MAQWQQTKSQWIGLNGRCRPFTLIELLVVITIIAILASLLLPALNATKERARMTTCLGQVRQTVTTIHAYAADYQEYPSSWNYALDESGNENRYAARAAFSNLYIYRMNDFQAQSLADEVFHCTGDLPGPVVTEYVWNDWQNWRSSAPNPGVPQNRWNWYLYAGYMPEVPILNDQFYDAWSFAATGSPVFGNSGNPFNDSAGYVRRLRRPPVDYPLPLVWCPPIRGWPDYTNISKQYEPHMGYLLAEGTARNIGFTDGHAVMYTSGQ